MPTVTLIDERTASAVDSASRHIQVKKLSAVGMMKLYAALGPEKSLVDRYVGFAILAASVTAIDDALYPPARSAGEVEALVTKLDEHGLEAVAAALKALAPPEKEDVAEAAENL